MSVFARPLEWDHPKPVWIALLILAFLISWPLFLLLLAMLFFTGRLEGWKRAGLALWQEKSNRCLISEPGGSRSQAGTMPSTNIDLTP